jgi:hypothetical protein
MHMCPAVPGRSLPSEVSSPWSTARQGEGIAIRFSNRLCRDSYTFHTMFVAESPGDIVWNRDKTRKSHACLPGDDNREDAKPLQ